MLSKCKPSAFPEATNALPPFATKRITKNKQAGRCAGHERAFILRFDWLSGSVALLLDTSRHASSSITSSMKQRRTRTLSTAHCQALALTRPHTPTRQTHVNICSYEYIHSCECTYVCVRMYLWHLWYNWQLFCIQSTWWHPAVHRRWVYLICYLVLFILIRCQMTLDLSSKPTGLPFVCIIINVANWR